MSPEGVLATLRARGASVGVRCGRIHVEAPRGVLDDELKAAIIDQKTELLALLTVGYTDATVLPSTIPPAASTTLPERSAAIHLASAGITVRFVRDAAAAERAVEQMIGTSDEPIGIDLETAPLPAHRADGKAGLDPHRAYIRTIQLYGGGSAVYVFDMATIATIEPFAPVWNRRLVAHNAVFETVHLLKAGVRPDRIDCTLVAMNALENRNVSLAEAAEDVLGRTISKTEQKSDWSANELSPAQIAYAALDAVVAYQLWDRLRPRLAAEGRVRLYDLMRGAIMLTATMELYGIGFDAVRAEELLIEYQREADNARAGWLAAVPDVNPTSLRQIDQWLRTALSPELLRTWPCTERGYLKADRRTVAMRTADERFALLHRFLVADAQRNELRKFIKAVHPVTGRLHGDFQIGGANTGRFTCKDPNLQGVPRDSRIRSLFVAPPGRVLLRADFGQIDLRVGAEVSGEPVLLEAFAHGEDQHRRTAAALANVSVDAVTPAQRQAAKAVTFGIFYGMGAPGLAAYARDEYGVTMTERQARANIAAFFRSYPRLNAWRQHIIEHVRQTGAIATPSGRVRTLPKAKGYLGISTVVPGGTAEVLLATLGVLADHLGELDAKLVNCVHDELLLDVREDHAEPARRAVEAAMIAGMQAIFTGATTNGLVDAKIGRSWTDAKGTALRVVDRMEMMPADGLICRGGAVNAGWAVARK